MKVGCSPRYPFYGERYAAGLSGSHRRCFSQLGERLRQCSDLVVRVEAAWVGKDPEPRFADGALLRAHDRPALVEGDAVSGHAQKCEEAGLPPPDLAGEGLAARDELFWGQLVGTGGGAHHDVGYAETVGEQLLLLERIDQPGGETGKMDSRPEAIAGPREMVARRSGIEAGIDAAEEDPQVVCDDVGDGGRARGLQLLPRRLRAGCQLSSDKVAGPSLPSSSVRNPASSRASDSEIDITQRASSLHQTLKRT